MWRLLFVGVGTYAVWHTDLDSPNVLHATAFPLVNVFYLGWLLGRFWVFLQELSSYGSQGKDAHIGDLTYGVLSVLHDRIAPSYTGRLSFLGVLAGPVEDLLIYLEFILVFAFLVLNFQLLGQLAH